MQLLQYYKKGQGTITRWTAGICVALLILYGGICLYRFIDADRLLENGKTEATFWGIALLSLDFFDFAITPRFILALLFTFAGWFATYYFVVNRTKSAEFLISTEDELRKVSWPQRNEYLGSSFAVIISVLILGLFILLADEVLKYIMLKIL